MLRQKHKVEAHAFPGGWWWATNTSEYDNKICYEEECSIDTDGFDTQEVERDEQLTEDDEDTEDGDTDVCEDGEDDEDTEDGDTDVCEDGEDDEDTEDGDTDVCEDGEETEDRDTEVIEETDTAKVNDITECAGTDIVKQDEFGNYFEQNGQVEIVDNGSNKHNLSSNLDNIDHILNDKSINSNHCYICKNEKEMLSCDCECDIGVCHSCMSIQIHKFLQPYDYTWQGRGEVFVLDDNIDNGGISWNCPGCDVSSVITERELKLCAKAKSTYDKAISILKA